MTTNSTSEDQAMTTQTKTAHTAGPWALDECFGRDHEHSHYEICAPAPDGFDTHGFNYVVADTASRGDNHISAEEDKANAQIMAAAPDMLEALEAISQLESHADSLVGMVDNPHTKALRSACKKARLTIQKARGGHV